MKKKYFWYLMTFVMVVMLGVGFASCGDDDDDNGGKNSLVGTWQFYWEIEGYEGCDELTFKADGTGYYREYSIEGKTLLLDETTDFKWTFDEERMKLHVSFINGYDATLNVNLLTSKKLVLDGDEFVRKK